MITLAKKKSFSDWIEIDGTKLKIDYPTQEQEMKLQEITLESSQDEKNMQLKYARLYIKYTVKDWKEEDLGQKCLVVNDELEDDLWRALVVDATQSLTIFGKIFEELNFSESDKKKS